MNKTTFSIIVPVYKVEKYLSQCVNSLLRQDFDDYEIILVDDGSPDACPIICDRYAAKNDKVKVIHKTNGGLSDARNAGISIASGLYITFVDSDDFWRGTDVLKGINKTIESNQYPDVVVSDFIKYFDKIDKYLEPHLICSEEINGESKQKVLEYLYFSQADLKMSAWQKFVKRDFMLNAKFEKGLLSEDIDWSFSVYPYAKSIAVYPKPYYCYRQQREGSITNTASSKSFDSLMYILDKWKLKIKEQDISEDEKEIYLGYLCYQLSISMALYCNLSESERPVALNRIAKHKDLFSYKLNKKTKAVKRFVDIIGIRNTCVLLRFYLQMRRLLKLG